MATIKLLHVLFMFIWMGNLLATTRILGYLSKQGEIVQQQVAAILRRMRLFVGLPSMALAWTFGLILIKDLQVDGTTVWFHIKMTFAFFLIVCEFVAGRQIYGVLQRPIQGSCVQFKILHGCVGLFLIAVLCTLYLMRPYVCTGRQKSVERISVIQQEKLLGKNPHEV